MSKAQKTGPDLHEIFGMDGEDGRESDVISVGRRASGRARGEQSDMEDAQLESVGADLGMDSLDNAEPSVAYDGADDVDGEVELPGVSDADLDIELDEIVHHQDRDDGQSTEEERADWSGVTHPSQRGSSQRFLTDVIVEMGLSSREVVDEALESSRISGTTPERVLVERGSLTSDGLARALAERHGLDHLDLGVFSVNMSAANLVSTPIAKRYQAVPVEFTDKRTLLVAMADPSNVLAVDDIAIMTGYEVRVAVAAPDDILALVGRLDRMEDVVGEAASQEQEEQEGAEVVSLHETSDDAPVVKLVNQIVSQGVQRGARTSTSRRKAATCVCASASTAFFTTSPPSRGAWRPGWSRASRSWPSWISPSGACPRMGASGSSSRDAMWTFASSHCPASTARAS